MFQLNTKIFLDITLKKLAMGTSSHKYSTTKSMKAHPVCKREVSKQKLCHKISNEKFKSPVM